MKDTMYRWEYFRPNRDWYLWCEGRCLAELVEKARGTFNQGGDSYNQRVVGAGTKTVYFEAIR